MPRSEVSSPPSLTLAATPVSAKPPNTTRLAATAEPPAPAPEEEAPSSAVTSHQVRP